MQFTSPQASRSVGDGSLGSLLFFIIFYAGYFYVTSGAGAMTFIQTIASDAKHSLVCSLRVVRHDSLLFHLLAYCWKDLPFYALSLCFIAGLFFLAVALNKRFGLYEPPAITVSRGVGVYAPKTGFLGRIGFSAVEAALVRKDFRAYTRRRELMTSFYSAHRDGYGAHYAIFKHGK